MGFTGAEGKGLVARPRPGADAARHRAARRQLDDERARACSSTGDMQRGQSLIVWAIADGRSTARGVDTWLMGASELPAPVQ